MDLSRRGFMAAITSTLATAVPLSMAETLKPPVVPVPPAAPKSHIPITGGRCRDCASWASEAWRGLYVHGHKKGFCIEQLATPVGVTSADFGCTFYKPRAPGHCRDCRHWYGSHMRHVVRDSVVRVEGYCEHRAADKHGFTDEDFGCGLFEPKED